MSTIGNKTELFHCKGSGAEGVGEYTSEGFVVLKGSRCRKEMVASSIGTNDERARQKLIDEGVLVESNAMLEFTRNYLFTSPSRAAVIVMGRAANGWNEWKTVDGCTLDAVKRQVVEPTQ